MENNNKRRPLRKGAKVFITVLIIIIFSLGALAGTWFGSKAFYAKQPMTVKVPASARVYPGAAESVIDLSQEVNHENSWNFHEVVNRFIFDETQTIPTDLGQLIDGNYFPFKVQVFGVKEKEGYNIYYATSSCGYDYMIVIPNK